MSSASRRAIAAVLAVVVALGLVASPAAATVAPDAETAHDVLHATFAKALDALPKVESLKAWLFRVALNEALLLRRRCAIHQRATLKLRFGPQRHTERPEELLVRRETVERVRGALECLPTEQQTVVRMRIYEEKPFAQIAKELSVPLGTVLTRMRLALGKLRKRLKSED